MRRISFTFFMLFLVIQIGSINDSVAAPGDSISEALTANLGMNNGTITAYNEVDNYNFSANWFVSYNFTLYIPANDIISLYISDSTNSLIASNFSGIVSKSLILGGRNEYIIKIISSEFIVPPVSYSLIIEEVVGEPHESLRSAEIVNIGNNTGGFEFYNDVHWYNFTGKSDKIYNFTVYGSDSAYLGLYIYDYKMQLINKSWFIDEINLYNVTGYEKFIIVIYSSEFVVFPTTYTLVIEDITPVISTPMISTSSTLSIDSPETVTVTASDNNPLASLPFPWLFLIPILLGIPILRKKRN